MYPYSTIVVAEHIEFLRRESAIERMFPARPRLSNRLVSALRAAREAVTTEAPAATNLTPALSDYPYRS